MTADRRNPPAWTRDPRGRARRVAALLGCLAVLLYAFAPLAHARVVGHGAAVAAPIAVLCTADGPVEISADGIPGGPRGAEGQPEHAKAGAPCPVCSHWASASVAPPSGAFAIVLVAIATGLAHAVVSDGVAADRRSRPFAARAPPLSA